MKVALLEGCVQRIAFAKVNEATVRVLAAEGCSVDAPQRQGCCGALPLHAGHIEQARRARAAQHRGLRERWRRSHRRQRGRLRIGDEGLRRAVCRGPGSGPSRARAIAAKVRDVSEVLADLGEQRAVRHPTPGARRLSRCLPPRARSGRPHPAPRATARRFPVSSSSPRRNQRFAAGAPGSTTSFSPIRPRSSERAKSVTSRRCRRI